jgi:hypothetical protein
MTPPRRTALIAGVLFILTFVTSITGLLLYGPVLHHHDYVLGSGADARISLGALCEILLIVANIGTAVVLFPILRRQSEATALGYVASRIIEGAMIAVGIVSLLSVVTLRKDLAGTGADSASLELAGRTLVAIHDWTFLLGPAFCAGFGNGLLLGWLMYRSGLVPPRLALIGVIGGPLLIVVSTGVLFGLYSQTSTIAGIATLPEAIWEAALGIYLVWKGFRASSPILAASVRPALA